MFPEFGQVKLLSEAAHTTSQHYFSLVLLVWEACERRDLPDYVQSATYSVGNYLILAGSAIKAFSQVFLAAQNGIRCSDEVLDYTLLGLNSASNALDYSFDILCKSSGNVLASLSALEHDALAALSYPPVMHYAIVHIIGAQWTDRQYALAKLARFVERVEQDVDRIVSLAVELRLAIRGLCERFSVSKLREIRTLGKERAQVSELLARTAHFVSQWEEIISFRGRHILRFNTSILMKSANHRRPE